MPHRRAAGRAGDRLGRPPHRPHAARRRRRGQLLDAHARRRGRRGRGLHAGARRAARDGRAAARARAGGRSSRAPGGLADALARARGAPGAPASAPSPAAARGPRRLPATADDSERRLTAQRALVLRRKADSSILDCRRRRPRDLEQLALALSAHDPQRTLERGYVLVQSPQGEPLLSAAQAREADEVGLRFARARSLRRSSTDERRSMSEPPQHTRPRRRASRRSSAAWTPARPASQRDARAGAGRARR